jgi:hypothetical protein
MKANPEGLWFREENRGVLFAALIPELLSVSQGCGEGFWCRLIQVGTWYSSCFIIGGSLKHVPSLSIKSTVREVLNSVCASVRENERERERWRESGKEREREVYVFLCVFLCLRRAEGLYNSSRVMQFNSH